MVVRDLGETAVKRESPLWLLIRRDIGMFSICVCCDQTRYFRPNQDHFLTLTNRFLCLARP